MLRKIIIAISVLLILLLGSYYNAVNINTLQLNVRKETLKSNKIDKDLDNLLIIYFSDLHFGKYIDEAFLNKLINKINMFKPDVIIFGGNLIEQNLDQEVLTDALKSLEARYGKYTVLSENDGQLVQEVLLRSNFIILENDNHPIMVDKNSYINLIGIDHLVDGNPDSSQAFNGINNTHYSIVVSHCPDIYDDIEGYEFDYMLSGHSKGGQVYLPIINLFNRPEGAKKHFKGKTTRNNKTLDITNGVGRSKYNARFLADAEIVLYTLSSVE